MWWWVTRYVNTFPFHSSASLRPRPFALQVTAPETHGATYCELQWGSEEGHVKPVLKRKRCSLTLSCSRCWFFVHPQLHRGLPLAQFKIYCRQYLSAACVMLTRLLRHVLLSRCTFGLAFSNTGEAPLGIAVFSFMVSSQCLRTLYLCVGNCFIKGLWARREFPTVIVGSYGM